MVYPASILYKSIAGRYRPVSYPDGPITARYTFIQNAYRVWYMATTRFHSGTAVQSLYNDHAREKCIEGVGCRKIIMK